MLGQSYNQFNEECLSKLACFVTKTIWLNVYHFYPSLIFSGKDGAYPFTNPLYV